MTARSSSLAQFLHQYATPSERGRFFTRSQIFIAYRAFLSRTKSSELLTMDYAIFSSEFEEEIKHIQLQTKQLGRSKYYKLFKSEKLDSDAKKSGNSMLNDKANVKILLNDLNIYLCCGICCGYLVDATTITECLHSFCKSCIVQHLHFKLACPVCNTSIHSTNPLSSLKADIVLQDVVNKLLPGVAENEQKRMNEFEKDYVSSRLLLSNVKRTGKPHCLVTVILEWVGSNSSTLPAEDLVQKYIRTSDEATVAHMAQFVLQKLEKVDKTLQPTVACDILSGGVVLPSILTIHDVIKNELDFEFRKGLSVFKYDLKPFA